MKVATRFERLHVALLPCLGLLLGFVSRPGAGDGEGGPEIFCVGSTEYVESWASIPAGGIPWLVATGVGGGFVAPGLPPVACSVGLPFDQQPGLQSLCRSARTWTSVRVPFIPPPGSSAVPVLPPPIATNFRLTPNPVGFVTWTAGSTNVDRCVSDGQNLVTAYQPASWWIVNGGAAAAAACLAHLSTSTVTPARIVDADIALNVSSTVNGRSAWCFVESNGALQAELAIHGTVAGPGTFVDPAIGYGDLQGIVTHEFGHFAGLAHSLVDSRHENADDEVPTMFLWGYGTSYSANLSVHDGSAGCSRFPVATNVGLTAYGGLMGRSARTLQIDDIASIGAAYPTGDYITQLGSIRGNCRLLVDSVSTPIAGVHVVAHRRDLVDEVRVGTVSRSDGSYTISGLPPGDYYVYAEPVDQPPSLSAPQSGYYFNAFTIPNIAYQGTFPLPSGLTGRGCLPGDSQPRFRTEYRDVAEAFSEYSPMDADIVPVGAGISTDGIDFRLTSEEDDLKIHRSPYAANRGSARGMIVSPMGEAFPSVDFRIEASPAHANRPYMFVLSTRRLEQSIAGQFLQPDLATGLVVNGLFDAAGNATITLPLNPSMAFTNYFAQAVTIHPTGAIWLTNPANLWLATR